MPEALNRAINVYIVLVAPEVEPCDVICESGIVALITFTCLAAPTL